MGVAAGPALGPLMPRVLADAATAAGGRFDLVGVENTLFGRSVTTAGLLPAAAIERGLAGRKDLDVVLLPAGAVDAGLVFGVDLGADDLAARLPAPGYLSYDFADALGELGTRYAGRGTDSSAS